MADGALTAFVVIRRSGRTIRADKLCIIYCFSSALHTWISTNTACTFDLVFVVTFPAYIPVWIGIAFAFPYPDRITAQSTCRLSKCPVKAIVTMASVTDFALAVKATETAGSRHN